MDKAAVLKRGDLIIDPYRGPGVLLNRINLWQNYTEEQDCWVWEVKWSCDDTSYSVVTGNINEANLIRLIKNGIIKHYKNGGQSVGREQS